MVEFSCIQILSDGYPRVPHCVTSGLGELETDVCDGIDSVFPGGQAPEGGCGGLGAPV